MRKIYWLILGFLTGIIGFYYLPPQFKIVTFFIPLLILSNALTSPKKRFNFSVFFIILFIFVLFPTNLFTFDAATPMNVANFYTFTSIFNIIVLIFFIGIPVIAVIGAIYAFIIGQISQGVKVLAQVIIVMVVMMITAFFMDITGFDRSFGGIFGMIMDFYGGLLRFIASLPVYIYNGLDTLESWFAIDNLPQLPADLYHLAGIVPPGGFQEAVTGGGVPSIPSTPGLDSGLSIILDTSAVWGEFSAFSYHEFLFAIHDSFPISLGLVCLVTALAYSKKDWEKQMEGFFLKFETPKIKKPRRFFSGLNFKLVFYAVILIIAGFGIFLNYANIYDREGATIYELFTTVGFFSIYLFMSIIPAVFMNFRGLVYYRDSNARNTVEGAVYGVMGLFLFFQLFNSGKTLTAYSFEKYPSDLLYILNTFIFVAPSESLMFHVFIPSVVSGAIIYYTKRKIKQNAVFDVDIKINELIGKIEAQKKTIEIYKALRKTKQAINAESELNDLIQQKHLYETRQYQVRIDEKSIYGRTSSLVILIVAGIIVPNFIFSSFHFWASPLEDFFIFWMSGLGMLYFAGGCWFSFIALRYGWLGCILTHAIYNSLNIILVLAFEGVT